MTGVEIAAEGFAWGSDAFGEPTEMLHWRPHTWAHPAPGRMLVKVRAAGVGLPDLLMTRGQYVSVPKPPVFPGQEVCGDVVAVNPGSLFSVGDRVMGLTPFAEGEGGFAEYAYVRESKAALVPDSVSDIAAAGFMLAYRTANAALHERIQLQAGQTVAVLGAAGSSGLAAIKFAHGIGARVIAIASSDDKLAFCRQIGADEVINYASADTGAELLRLTEGRGVDVLFDPVGGPVASQATAGLASRGQIAVIGYASGSWYQLNPVDLVLRNYTVVGVFAGGFTEAQDIEANKRLHDLCAAGTLTTAVGTVHDLDQAPHVLESLQGAVAPGKVILTAPSV